MIRRYESEDFGQIESWLKKREMKVFHPNILPNVGFIIDETAAIFVYQTDSDLCYIENLVSNPETEAETRDRAIKNLTNAAFNEAKQLGFKFVMAVTDVPAVIQLALTQGAKAEPNKVLLTKQLK